MYAAGRHRIFIGGQAGSGAAVTVIGGTAGTDGNTWYQIQFRNGRAVNTGYVHPFISGFPVAYTTDSNFEAYLTSQGFRRAIKTGSGSFMPNIPIGYSKPKHRSGLEYGH